MPEDYPQVVFLGLAERAEQVREGETAALKLLQRSENRKSLKYRANW
jgi:hypothetical protein